MRKGAKVIRGSGRVKRRSKGQAGEVGPEALFAGLQQAAGNRALNSVLGQPLQRGSAHGGPPVQFDVATMKGMPKPPPLVSSAKPPKPGEAPKKAIEKSAEALIELIKKNPHVKDKLEELKAKLKKQLKEHPALMIALGAVLAGTALTIAEASAQGTKVPSMPAIPLDGLGEAWAGWSLLPQYKGKFGELGKPDFVGLAFAYKPPVPKAGAKKGAPEKFTFDPGAVAGAASSIDMSPFEAAGPKEEAAYGRFDIKGLAVRLAEKIAEAAAKGGGVVTVPLGEYPFGNPGPLAASLQDLVEKIAPHVKHKGVTVHFTYNRPGKGMHVLAAKVPGA